MLLKRAALFCVLLFLMLNVQNSLFVTDVLAGQDKRGDAPEVWYGNEKDIPVPTGSESLKDNRSWLSKNKWWVALGAILAGGAAAAGGGGGGSSSVGGGNTPAGGDEPQGGSGTYTSTW